MKNILLNIWILLLGCFVFISCEKDEIGGTATEVMAGEWYVTGVAVDADDNLVYGDDDLFGLGHFHLDTYNTSSNGSTTMWIDDNGNFYYHFKGKINVDLNTSTFQANDIKNEYAENTIKITNGRILKGAATTPSGMAADSIVFNVVISTDEFPGQYGFESYRIAGYRYTGFTNDN